MSLVHFAGEIDLDISEEAKRVYDKLFDICEATGFMPSREKYGFSVVGPFNIPDCFDLELQFQLEMKENLSRKKTSYIKDTRAVLRDANTRKIKQIWYIVKDGKETEEAKRPML